jgi:hypothetical protein
MSRYTGWFSSPSIPKPQPVPPPPTDAAAASAAENATSSLLAKRRGASASILTSGAGVSNYSEGVQKKTLLGS